MKHLVVAVIGETKDPGVKLYKNLRDSWNDLAIDYENLCKFDWNSSDNMLVKIARESLDWALFNLKEGTWPRDDYQVHLHYTNCQSSKQ